jgi:hypothetical protein
MCAWFDTFIGNNRMLKWVSRFDKRVSLLMHISRLPARIIYLINDRKIQFAKLIREYTPSPLLSLFFLPSLSFSLSFPDSHRHPRFICLDSSSSSSRCEHSNLSKLIWQRSLSRSEDLMRGWDSSWRGKGAKFSIIKRPICCEHLIIFMHSIIVSTSAI